MSQLSKSSCLGPSLVANLQTMFSAPVLSAFPYLLSSSPPSCLSPAPVHMLHARFLPSPLPFSTYDLQSPIILAPPSPSRSQTPSPYSALWPYHPPTDIQSPPCEGSSRNSHIIGIGIFKIAQSSVAPFITARRPKTSRSSNHFSVQ